MTESDSTRDWRRAAYLRKENWPEAIPPTGPKREYGPYSWGEKSHDDPNDVDSYPSHHPDAASVAETCLGDVCPYCGVPLDWMQDVVLIDGTHGRFCDINTIENPEVAYHPSCWKDRQAEIHELENTTLGEYA